MSTSFQCRLLFTRSKTFNTAICSETHPSTPLYTVETQDRPAGQFTTVVYKGARGGQVLATLSMTSRNPIDGDVVTLAGQPPQPLNNWLKRSGAIPCINTKRTFEDSSGRKFTWASANSRIQLRLKDNQNPIAEFQVLKDGHSKRGALSLDSTALQIRDLVVLSNVFQLIQIERIEELTLQNIKAGVFCEDNRKNNYYRLSS